MSVPRVSLCYNFCKEQWEPRVGEVLPLEESLSIQKTSVQCPSKMIVDLFGHVSFNLTPVVWAFQRNCQRKDSRRGVKLVF